MKVVIELFGASRDFSDKNFLDFEVENNSTIKDIEVKNWIKNIYNPTNRFISQIIKPLAQEIKELAADPYDDELMNNFCSYISLSQKKIEIACCYKNCLNY